MGFSCDCELEILGSSPEDRRRAANLVLALDYIDDSSAFGNQKASSDPGSKVESGDRLVLRFLTVDGLPEEELAALAQQFPAIGLTLAYYSKDGEFFAYARTGASGTGSESEDLAEETSDVVERGYNGDGIAFVKERFGLGRT